MATAMISCFVGFSIHVFTDVWTREEIPAEFFNNPHRVWPWLALAWVVIFGLVGKLVWDVPAVREFCMKAFERLKWKIGC